MRLTQSRIESQQYFNGTPISKIEIACDGRRYALFELHRLHGRQRHAETCTRYRTAVLSEMDLV